MAITWRETAGGPRFDVHGMAGITPRSDSEGPTRMAGHLGLAHRASLRQLARLADRPTIDARPYGSGFRPRGGA
jgi:hypothetical protein